MKTIISIILIFIACNVQAQKFAIISDFGSADSNQAKVAALVRSYQPQFIITAGDNFHKTNTALDRMVRDYYGWIFPQFYPVPGNHDITDPVDYWLHENNYLANYRDYFPWIPSQFGRRYYSFVKGDILFGMINSDFGGNYSYCPNKNKVWEPDGIDSTSRQGNHFSNLFKQSTTKFNLAVFHLPGFFSFPYNNDTTTIVNCNGTPHQLRLKVDTLHQRLRWNFKEWGVSLVINAHTHCGEHLKVKGLDYYLQLSGGAPLGTFFTNRNPHSKFFYKALHGFTLAEVKGDSLQLRLINVNNIEVYKFAVYPQKAIRIKAKVKSGADSVTAELRSTELPYHVIDTATRKRNLSGEAIYYFGNAEKHTPYNLRLLHRNSIAVWSSQPVQLQDSVFNLDMTDSYNVYGSNLDNNGAMYSGDVNQDKIIDATDYQRVDNDAMNFNSGYVGTDLNGDGVVDSGDIQIIETNVRKVIVEERK
jgi:hypothetical protein